MNKNIIRLGIVYLLFPNISLKMKLTTLFLLIALFRIEASTYSQNTKITLDLEAVSMMTVFNEIEAKSEFKFLGNQDVIDTERLVSVHVHKERIDNILTDLFKGTDISFKIIDRQIVLKRVKPKTPLIESPDIGFNREKKLQFLVTGTITDQSGTPMPGANILEKGTTNGTQADFDGNFSISVEDENAVLTVSYIGYATKEISINGQTNIMVSLEESAVGMDEVVVVGYGTVKKSDLTGSVSSVTSEEIAQVPVTSVSSALQGRAAGVSVNQASGQPGQGVVIRVRGNNSISGGNNPLYVVDGFPLNDFGSDINPEDIKSMEILKDASSTAIYGARGANGVILITTKRGAEGKAKVSYHGYQGFQTLRNKIDLLNRDTYVEMVNGIAAAEGDTPVFSAGEIADLPNNDWQDLVYRTASMQNHQVSVSGGNDVAKYYTSFNYLNQEGIINNSGFKRYSVRINGDLKISERLSLQNNLAITWSEYNQANDGAADGYGAIPFTSLVMPPTDPIRENDGSYSVFSGVPWGGTNPVAFANEDMFQRLNTRIIGSIDLNYKILDGLSFNTNLGLTALTGTTNSYRPIGIISSGPSDGQASKSTENSFSLVNENILNFSKEFGKHTIGALAGMTYQKDKQNSLSASGTGFLTDAFGNNNLQSAANRGTPSTGFNDAALISYLSRANYTFDDRYLMTLTARYDGSSKFGKNNKYAFFPSAALAWKISNEEFLADSKNINDLKLRFSYGKSGNQAIGSYQTLARLRNTSPVFDDTQNVGFVLSAFENPDLKWETTTAGNIGVDLGLFNNRINLIADYYTKNTEDLLFNAILPTSSGFTSSVRNVGEIENKGFEFELTTKNFVGDFNWTTSLNMNFNRNKVVSLGTDGLGNKIERIDAPGGGGNWFPLFLGEPGQQLYGFEIEGIYETDAEADQNGEPNKTAGDYRFKDTNGNGIVNNDDQTILSNLQPDFTFGFNNEFSYKNFDLTILMVGSVGNDIVNEFNKYYTAITGDWNVTQEAWNNRWTGPGSGGTYAKASSNAINTVTFAPPTSLWVEDGSYIKFRDIKLGYNLSKAVVDRIGLERLKLYISGQNLITITNYSHYDPEAQWESAPVNGWDRGVYPSTKSVTLGVMIDL